MKTLARAGRDPFPSIPSLFEDFIMRDWLDSNHGNWKSSGSTLPAVNVGETDDAFLIEVAAPGMKKEDFHVELDNHMLTISSRREQRKDDGSKDGRYTRTEFSYQTFQRSFALPEDRVEAEKISARYQDGILHLTVPKKEEARIKPPKQINVS